MTRTMVVTNDFPPSQGGMETFIRSLAGLLPSDGVVVYTSSMAGDASYDASVPFPVLRDPARTLLPTAKVTAGVLDAFQAYGCDRALFGAAAPLGLLASALRDAGALRLVGLTHSRECWWSRVPGTRQVLRRVGDATDALTYLDDATRSAISSALSPAAAGRMVQLAPGVDPTTFRPHSGGSDIRRRYGIPADALVVVSVARLSGGRGQDVLIRAFRRVLDGLPQAWLLVVGGGHDGPSLAELARSLGVADRVVLTGPVPWAVIPPYFDAGDVFALLRRTRLRSREPSPLNLAVLEAQASGLPVVVGGLGGGPDPIRTGRTGSVVDPRSPERVADRLVELLTDSERAGRMGRAGRAMVERTRSTHQVRSTLVELLR